MSVWPSGLARAAAPAPIMVLPPAMLSTITGTPSDLDIGAAMRRAIWSDEPPAAYGTIRWIGLKGNACAMAAPAMPRLSATAVVARAREVFNFIIRFLG